MGTRYTADSRLLSSPEDGKLLAGEGVACCGDAGVLVMKLLWGAHHVHPQRVAL